MKEALEAFAHAVGKGPEMPSNRMAMATALAAAHRPDEAMRHYEAMRRLYPGNDHLADFELKLATAFWQNGYAPEAQLVARRAEQI